ncbi:DUF2769 domain-containing protein [Methanosarcina horonobensis]|uniref:DUF2769 domain-containing protein n=1 Tax=Methanosarcina horonobensis TaxID=418008 RepID=UPI0022B92327|nr:DUF2769 domain-containing protein [Methanosarcina horonobensis]
MKTSLSVWNTAEHAQVCLFHLSLYFFCARGCSLEKVSKKSCNCPACPVYKKYGLQNLYFCETGKAVGKKEHKVETKI